MVSSELRSRIITGAILVGGFVALDLLAIYLPFGRIVLGLVGAAVVALCAYEVAVFTFRARKDLQHCTIVIFSLAPALVFFSSLGCSMAAGQDCGAGPFAGSVAIGAVFLFLMISLLSRSSLSTMLQAISTCILGFLLVSVGGAALVSVGMSAAGGLLIAWLVAVVSVNDIAAFACGSIFRGPKLAPAISPGKTISGGIGGVVIGAAAGGTIRNFLAPGSSWLFSLTLGVVVAIAAQNGDLMKSILKRLWGVKDSGNILPGHGGVLDRIDGILGGALILFAALECGFLQQQ